MTDFDDDDQSAATAQALFERERLPFPPVPGSLQAQLVPCGAHAFATRKLPQSPYDLDAFVAEAEGNVALKEYAVAGFDGHGINSWAAHYYVVCEGLALFIQLPWGGAYIDADAARADIEAHFQWAATVQGQLAQARRQGKVPADWRLLVVLTAFGQSGWRWLVPGNLRAMDARWNPEADMRETISGLLEDILSAPGAGRPGARQRRSHDH